MQVSIDAEGTDNSWVFLPRTMHWCVVEWIEHKDNKLVVNLDTICDSAFIEFTLLAIKFA